MLNFEPLVFVVCWCVIWWYFMPQMRAAVALVGGGYVFLWTFVALLVTFFG